MGGISDIESITSLSRLIGKDLLYCVRLQSCKTTAKDKFKVDSNAQALLKAISGDAVRRVAFSEIIFRLSLS